MQIQAEEQFQQELNGRKRLSELYKVIIKQTFTKTFHTPNTKIRYGQIAKQFQLMY